MHFGAGGANLAKIVPRCMIVFQHFGAGGGKPSQNSSQETVFVHFGAGGGKPSQNSSQDIVCVDRETKTKTNNAGQNLRKNMENKTQGNKATLSASSKKLHLRGEAEAVVRDIS